MGRSGFAIRLGFLFLGQQLDLVNQRVHQLFDRHLPDKLALLEQNPFAFAAGDADVGFLAFADAVHDAAKHGHVQGRLDMAQFLLQLIGHSHHVDLYPAAGRTGDDIDAAMAQFERLENLETDLDLFDRIGRE